MKKGQVRSTTMFRIYFYEKQSKGGMEEGTLYLTDKRHKLTKDLPEEHFNSFDDIPRKIRKLLRVRDRL